MSKIIIFPTDTVYGIGTSVYDKASMEKIFEIKKRPKDKPLAVLCASLEQIEEIAIVNDAAKKLIDAFMPGGLTIVLKAREEVQKSFMHETIGVRIPNHNLAISVLKENGPMATTSVNESGKQSLNDYNIIKEQYDDLVDEILPPDGETSSNLASTVISLIDDTPKVLRQGAITLDLINKVLNK